MYNKFKNCLLKPSQIYEYVDETFWKMLIYFLILTLIYVLPNIASITSFRKVGNNTLTQIVNGFEKSEDIHYQLINVEGDIKLIPKKIDYKPQVVYLEKFIENYDVVLLFHLRATNIENYQLPNELVGKTALYFAFYEDSVEVYFAQYQGIFVNGDGGIQQMSNTLSKNLYKTSYEKLGVSEIDFTITRENTTTFSRKINDLIMSVYNHHKVAILFSIVPMIYVMGIIQFLIDALILALLVKLLYSQYGLKFGKIFKLVILTYTPRVIFNILSIFWSNMFMFILGEIISVVYLLIAMRYYAMSQMIEKK
jgi:hypothetical protein